jgi:pre-mRNA-processing factor 8
VLHILRLSLFFSKLLLSDRILGMTLVPEGKVWNYGIGLTQMWTASLPYSVLLDTPLLFWSEAHRPVAFLTVCRLYTEF